MSNAAEEEQPQGLTFRYGAASLKMFGQYGLLAVTVLAVVFLAGYVIYTDIAQHGSTVLPDEARASSDQIQATIANHELLIRNQAILIDQHEAMIKRNTDIMETMEAMVYMMSLTEQDRRKIRLEEPVKIRKMRQ